MRGETIQRRKQKIEEERRLGTASTRLHLKFSDCGKTHSDNLLADTGATSHIINDKSKSISFDADFDPNAHIIELADGSKAKVVTGEGVAKVKLTT